DAVVERFRQTAPKFLIAGDGYAYNGRAIGRLSEIAETAARLPSVRRVIVAPFLAPDAPPPAGTTAWEEAANSAAEFPGFYRGDFNAPLLALFSSGTTGAPKCIVHSAGGVLLQHLKELGLHLDVGRGAPVFYFTTCGWMMWNWLISALALEAAPVLYEGAPLHSSSAALWDMAEREKIALFGASAKYFDALRGAGLSPAKTHSLPALKTICSTGSPLSPEGFDYVYEHVKADAQLASISGGTDIVSCFALGNPLDAVRRGELQGRGLGMAVAVYDENGEAAVGAPGELVCEAPFPAMPLRFYGDTDGGIKYRAAYFEHFPGVWRHGDWATLTESGGMVIHGRSDATLNPGGVRIGTAEIYRPLESFPEVAEALAAGQEWEGDTRIVVFVRLAAAAVLDDELRARLRAAVRRAASPRHVPAKIIAVADLPRTRSGKISEIAVRETIHDRPVKNRNALANPESLEYFRNLPELSAL
ncbi:MAG: acetoacetate--CoA ligase, partial [Gammaproteobacteria bacterium]